MNPRPAIVAFALTLSFTAAWAGDEQPDEDGRRCISTRSIRNTEIINDVNIVFYLQGNKVYRNTLPRRCHGLSRERRFSYTSRTGNLCANDLINVLDDFGIGMSSGRACRLGRFRPTTEEDIAEFEERLSAPVQARPPEPPPPQEVIPEDDDEAEEEGGQ